MMIMIIIMMMMEEERMTMMMVMMMMMRRLLPQLAELRSALMNKSGHSISLPRVVRKSPGLLRLLFRICFTPLAFASPHVCVVHASWHEASQSLMALVVHSLIQDATCVLFWVV